MQTIIQSGLFANIDQNHIKGLLNCVNAKLVHYKKDEFIINDGDQVTDFGIILSGSARSIKWDAAGRLIIITFVRTGSVLGVMIAAKPGQASPVAVQATQAATVMHIPFNRITTRCNQNCAYHETLLRNYIGAVAEKGLELHERINCLLEPSVRSKILAYLQRISKECGSKTFTIPINRNTMAEYLNIERSALSRELSSMKRDGLIEYKLNLFKLK